MRSNKNKTIKRNSQPNVWTVITGARTLFGWQLNDTQNLETKRKCIEQTAQKLYKDPVRIWYEIQTEAKVLTNRVDFNNLCAKYGLDSSNVAEHIVFEGKTKLWEITKNGVEIALDEKIRMYKDPLCDPKTVDKYISGVPSQQLSTQGEVDENKSLTDDIGKPSKKEHVEE